MNTYQASKLHYGIRYQFRTLAAPGETGPTVKRYCVYHPELPYDRYGHATHEEALTAIDRHVRCQLDASTIADEIWQGMLDRVIGGPPIRKQKEKAHGVFVHRER